jgi:rubrerythrin
MAALPVAPECTIGERKGTEPVGLLDEMERKDPAYRAAYEIYHCPACGTELTERHGGMDCPACLRTFSWAELRDA